MICLSLQSSSAAARKEKTKEVAPMEGKRKLTESLYLDELNATLDEISVELAQPLAHFKQIPNQLPVSIAIPSNVDAEHWPYYLRAEQIMRRHFDLLPG